MTEKQRELGELYRDLRIARGVKQKDVAKEGLSISQLSKFETGQSMLSADRMLLAIEGIHMTFEEFGLAFRNYEDGATIKLSREIAHLFMNQDVAGLTHLLKENQLKGKGIHNEILNIVIKNARYALDSNYPLEDVDKEIITTYLYSIESWTNFELYIFINTMGLLTDQDLIFLLNELFKEPTHYLSLQNNKKQLKRVVLNAISEMIERHISYYTGYFLDKLEQLLDPYDMFERTFLKYYHIILEYGNELSRLEQKMAEFIDHLAFFDDKELVQLFTLKFEQHKVWLNNADMGK